MGVPDAYKKNPKRFMGKIIMAGGALSVGVNTFLFIAHVTGGPVLIGSALIVLVGARLIDTSK